MYLASNQKPNSQGSPFFHKITQEAKNMEWDALAKEIMTLESLINNMPKKDPSIPFLSHTLEIYEYEKAQRVPSLNLYKKS